MTPEQELKEKIRALLRRRHGSDEPSALRQTFDHYDHNSDGHIEAGDLARVLEDAEVGNALTRKLWVRGVMARLDVNRDDRISWEEFLAVVKPSAPSR